MQCVKCVKCIKVMQDILVPNFVLYKIVPYNFTT